MQSYLSIRMKVRAMRKRFTTEPHPQEGRFLNVLVGSTASDALKLLGSGDLVGITSVVADVHLGGNLDLGVLGDELGRDGHALDDLDAGGDDGVVLHVGHTDELVDLGDAQPVERVGHHCLEARVGDAGHVAGAVEVLRGTVTALGTLAHVVHEVLGDLSEGAALLAEVDHHTAATLLGSADALLNGVGQVRSAGADIGTEHVGAVALVVDSHGEGNALIGDGVGVTPDVNGEATDGGKEQLDVRAGQQLGVHHVGLLEQGLAQGLLGALESLSNTGKVPHGLDGSLGDHRLSVGLEDLAIGDESAQTDSFLHLREIDVGLGDGNGGANIVTLLEVWLENGGHHVAPRIDGHKLLRILPTGERTEIICGGGHLQVGNVVGVQLARGNSKGSVNAVATAVGANSIALASVLHGSDHRTSNGRIGVTPVHGDRVGTKLSIVGGQGDVIQVGLLRLFDLLVS
mmetsp:Transcript_24876/g.42829  ORF Transcript_24876/g.42829 Transcript_24876/m.42829 type:complete len:459 (-) Transcript_24876:97-1473(-)